MYIKHIVTKKCNNSRSTLKISYALILESIPSLKELERIFCFAIHTSYITITKFCNLGLIDDLVFIRMSIDEQIFVLLKQKQINSGKIMQYIKACFDKNMYLVCNNLFIMKTIITKMYLPIKL